MLPRFSSHVTAMSLAILGASVGPSWSVGAADQLIEACKSSDQACEANVEAFASVVPAGGQRDRVLSTVAADLAEAALLAGTSGRQCSVAQTAILALSQKATATATRNQLTTLAASLCTTPIVTASIDGTGGDTGTSQQVQANIAAKVAALLTSRATGAAAGAKLASAVVLAAAVAG
mgnify:CR=1 FL=1